MKTYQINKRVATSIRNNIRAMSVTALALLAVFSVGAASISQFASAKGGGVPGDGFTTYVRYDAETCPLPQSIKEDYETILYCALAKRTGTTRDYIVRVDGYTQQLPFLADVRDSVSVTLPCGNVTSVSKFTENSFAQVSPVPPPYRLYTESTKISDTCIL